MPKNVSQFLWLVGWLVGLFVYGMSAFVGIFYAEVDLTVRVSCYICYKNFIFIIVLNKEIVYLKPIYLNHKCDPSRYFHFGREWTQE